MKRIFDFITSLILFIVLLPVFAVISLLIKTTMPGPVLFRQKRVGQFGKIFWLNKFRSMQVISGVENGSFDAGNNKLVTKLGYFLRKWKLDELPQLINVMKGEMSFVGPRPEVLEWTLVYPEKWEIVHQVRPGISDNASILFRNEEEILAASENPSETYTNEILPKKLDLYVEFVTNRSFGADLKIIFKTIITVLFK